MTWNDSDRRAILDIVTRQVLQLIVFGQLREFSPEPRGTIQSVVYCMRDHSMINYASSGLVARLGPREHGATRARRQLLETEQPPRRLCAV